MDFKSSGLKISEELLQNECSNIRNNIKNLQSKSPVASIVFCSYNEQDFLIPTLKSISKIDTKLPIEIIAVNNASTDRTREILEECWIIVIDEKIKWISYARNAWLNWARWDIILQTDSDTKVPSTWVDEHISYYDNQEVWWVAWYIKIEGVHKLYHLYKLWAITLQSFLHILWKWQNCYWWANLSYRKKEVLKVWWFDKWSNSYEDFLICSKISKLKKVVCSSNKWICVITSWRRYDSFSKVKKEIMLKIPGIIPRIKSTNWVEIGKNFVDIRW